MRSGGLQARRRRRRLPLDVDIRPIGPIAQNLLGGQFEVAAPNKRWLVDFIYSWTHKGRLYFAVVFDLISRLIVGWSTSSRMTAQVVTDAPVTAVWRRGRPEALPHHSDQGSRRARCSNACWPTTASPVP